MATLVAILSVSASRCDAIATDLADSSLEFVGVPGLDAMADALDERRPATWVVDAAAIVGREVECFERLEAWGGRTPVLVMIPGDDREQDMEAWFDLGADDCVAHLDELRSRVRHRVRLLRGVSRAHSASAAAMLARPQKFLERVIESSVDAIVATDVRGEILLFNPAASRIFGYTDAEIQAMSVTDLYPDDGAREVMRAIRSDENGGPGRLGSYRCELLGKNGATIPVSLSAALILEGGTPVATVGVFTDIREKLRMEARLTRTQEELQAREKQVALAELAGATAHELNQPLTSVIAYSELLQRAAPKDERVQNAANVVIEEAERIAEIVRKIGKITRYETQGYVGGSRILDIDKATDEPPEAR